MFVSAVEPYPAYVAIGNSFDLMTFVAYKRTLNSEIKQKKKKSAQPFQIAMCDFLLTIVIIIQKHVLYSISYAIENVLAAIMHDALPQNLCDQRHKVIKLLPFLWARSLKLSKLFYKCFTSSVIYIYLSKKFHIPVHKLRVYIQGDYCNQERVRWRPHILHVIVWVSPSSSWPAQPMPKYHIITSQLLFGTGSHRTG